MTASEYVDKLRNDFVKLNTDPNELDNLISVNNVEKRDVKGYHGREILELLQNADDAYQKLINSGAKPDCNLEIDISYFNNILTISNTGTFLIMMVSRQLFRAIIAQRKVALLGVKALALGLF